MKKITILSLHLGVGGIEKYISSLTKMLEGEYEIELIITYNIKETPKFLFNDKVKIKYLIDDSSNRDEIKRAIKRRKPFTLIKEIIKAIKILYLKGSRTKKVIKELETDYLITTRLYETKLVNKFLKKKNIVKILTEHNYPTNKYRRKLLRCTTNYDKVVVVNKEIESIYKKYIGEKVISISNFVDELSPKKTKLDSKNIIAVGRLSKEKGFLDLIEIMSLVVSIDPEVTLTLIGDGIEKERIIKKIKELNLEKNIILTGYLNQYEIEEKMLNSSIYVMTSISESFGLVMLEAMNIGVPVIGFDTSSGAKELIKDTGILIENRNKEKFANTIINLLKNKKELQELSKKSKEKVANYTASKIKKDWISLLKDVEVRSTKKVMFISSTGGHLNEMLMLSPMFKKYPFMLITENTKSNKGLKEQYGSRTVKYLVYGTRKKMLTYPFKLCINCFKSLYYFIKFRPDFVLTTGAHTAGPMCCIAHIFKKKVIYIETFANSETKTVTGSLVYKFADLFIVQWESMLKVYENATFGGWIY